MSFIVGAYAATPAHSEWKESEEDCFYESLRSLKSISGLELPLFKNGKLHRWNESALLAKLSPPWNSVITCLPGTMEHLQNQPSFGLASEDLDGWEAAIRFAEQAREAVFRVNQAAGRKAIRAVEIHSAPAQGKDGIIVAQEALFESLLVMRSWDWDGAELLIEHCDRYVPGQTAAKGFLSLEDEIAAIQRSSPAQVPCGILLNWGRSALEERDPDTPLRHIRQAREAGLLRGLIFSGCAQTDSVYGSWLDNHAPFSDRKSLLMTEARVRACVQASGPIPIRGFKIQPLPSETTTEDRLRLIADSVAILNRID